MLRFLKLLMSYNNISNNLLLILMILNFARKPSKISPFDNNNKLKSKSKSKRNQNSWSINVSNDYSKSKMSSSLQFSDNVDQASNILSLKAKKKNIIHRLTPHLNKKSFHSTHSDLERKFPTRKILSMVSEK